MRIVPIWSILLVLGAAPASAQPQYSIPRGSYQRHCTDIRLNGQFLSATCQGSQGGGQSSINLLSCATDISVDPSGALSCLGAGAAARQEPEFQSRPPSLPPAPHVEARPYRDWGRDYQDSSRSPGFNGYPQFKGLEAHIRSEIMEGLRDDLIERDDARDLLGQLRAFQTQEAREYRVHGWELPDEDELRLHSQLEQLDRLVDQIRQEQE